MGYPRKKYPKEKKVHKISFKNMYLQRELGDGDMDLMEKDGINELIKTCEDIANEQLIQILKED